MYPQHSIFLASYNLGLYAMIIPFFHYFMGGVSSMWNFLATPTFMILALIPAYFLAKYERVGLITMSTICGALFGTLIDLLLQQAGGFGTFFSLAIIFGLAAGICSFFFHAIFVILMTSFIGSYKIIRGISYYAGGFPEETQQIKYIQISDKIHPYFSNAYYGYFSGILVLFGLSAWF